MADWGSWFLLAGIFIVGEIFSGSFYLLPFGLAALMAGIAAFLRIGIAGQLAVAVITSILFWFFIQRWAVKNKKGQVDDPSFSDIGQSVYWVRNVSNELWRVRYRGAEWDAIPQDENVNSQEPLFIVAQKGNFLIVANGKERNE